MYHTSSSFLDKDKRHRNMGDNYIAIIFSIHSIHDNATPNKRMLDEWPGTATWSFSVLSFIISFLVFSLAKKNEIFVFQLSALKDFFLFLYEHAINHSLLFNYKTKIHPKHLNSSFSRISIYCNGQNIYFSFK